MYILIIISFQSMNYERYHLGQVITFTLFVHVILN